MKKKMQINKKKEERRGTQERMSKVEKTARPANAEKPIKATRPANAEKPIKSAERADAVCPYAKKCGGCDYQGMPYEKQLKEKQAYVQKQVGSFCKVLPILGMDEPYHYRNKVHAVFDIEKKRGSRPGVRGNGKAANGKQGNGRNGRLAAKPAPGGIISGVYKAGTHEVINIDACQIEDELSGAIIRDIRGLLHSFKIKTYDEDTGYGLLRHVLVRRGFHSGEVMVVLVLGSPVLPSKNHFVKALRELHPEISTVIVNVNDKRTSMVLGDKESVIYGKGYIEDTLCGCTFRISPKSFYQVNPVQTEILYGKAIAYATLTGNETVVDAYCGTGTIGIIAAKSAKKVIGVELNRDAVRDAVKNAKCNNVKNIEFYNADAGQFMVEMAEYRADAKRGEKSGADEVDVVFMDPPRAGSDEAFLASVVTLAPKRVVYVSCNPETLARDLLYLTKHGYRAQECQPVDMFPWTKHVETVVLLSHKKPDGHINVKVEFGEGEGKVPLDNIAKRAEEYKPKERVTYKMIKEYIEAKYGFKVHTAYIAEVKRDLGLPMYDAPNAVEELKQPRKHPTVEKVEAIKDALKHFEVI
ncbi:23S rRNA (uracil(1939)-C(5))-methyltransferase RlmD [Roseburia hominis]|uniref:23S rRNA (uracil(1939)-C(5))-methyltransferase RlmD n=1 Tax=Roseburia hominis TaxID=301301 RepID=UPI00265AEE76|nr:23S rRNA (uracil(1939)-C(5))-methyltransferase RlmD [Roseburia hominis]